MSDNVKQNRQAELNKRSCERCSQRKVRCDRTYPCGACVKATAQCSYPGPKRARRTLNRPPISSLVARLKYLEEEVTKLQFTGHSGHHTPDSNDCPENKTAKTELLILKEGKSRYVGDEASIALGEQISELRDIIESSSDEEDYSDSIPDPGILPDGALIGDHDYAWSLDAFRLQYSQPARIEALWKVYLENVAPLIAIIHKGSMAQIVQNACSSVELTSSDEVLLFSVYFAAIVSMKPHVCPSVLGVDHDTAMEDCKKAVSQGLRRANFIKCQHLSTLQAAVLFLLCCRVGGDTRLVWAESAIVIRVAQAQGVHRDGSHFGLPPFETEIRRRLWWHICLLDMLSSRDQGVDTQIRPEIFDTQFPTNVDDQYLLLNMTQHPEPNIGFTNMTVCIMFSEIMIKILWSRDPGQSSDKSTYEKESLITEIGQGLHEKYLNHFDLDIPIQWVFATIIRLQLSQLWLSVHFQSGEGSQDFQHDDRVFEMAVEVLQFAYLLQTNEATAQWSWLCKSYKEWHVVAFILSELCIRPLSPETDHAWDVVTKMYTLWQSNHPRSDALLERPLDRLMKRTTTSRSARQGGQTRLFDEAAMSGVPSFGVGDAGFDLNEVPDLFMGLEWLSGPLF